MPECPVRVHQDILPAELEEESCVAQPSDAHLVSSQIRKRVGGARRQARSQQVRDEHVIEKLQISLPPSFAGEQPHVIDGSGFGVGEADAAGLVGLLGARCARGVVLEIV